MKVKIAIISVFMAVGAWAQVQVQPEVVNSGSVEFVSDVSTNSCGSVSCTSDMPSMTMMDINRQISLMKDRLAEANKENPHVYYNEVDNPTMNIKRGLKATYINSEYYCPYHRGFKYVNGHCGWHDMIMRQHPLTISRKDRAGCPAMSNNINGYPVWSQLAAQVSVTQQKDAEIARCRARLDELIERRSALALANDLNDRAPESESQKSAQPVMITLSRVQVSELYSKRVLHYNGYTFKMKP